jgi:hypothetical protein
LIVKWGFAMVFHTCLHSTLINILTPSLTLSLLPCSSTIQQLSVNFLSYLNTEMQCI